MWNSALGALESTQIHPTIVPFGPFIDRWDPICRTNVLYTTTKHEMKPLTTEQQNSKT
jgi:hypothetical protein